MISIFCDSFRKETCVIFRLGVKILLRKEKCFLRKVLAFPRKQALYMRQKGENIMSNNSNKLNIPQAKQAMDQFKMQAAQEEDVFSTS